MRSAHRRLAGDDEQGGFAMVFALLLIFIVASLSIAVAGIVYNQVKPTQYERKSIATINAASAGLQVSIDQIRAASTTDAYGNLTGVLSQLRCSGPTGATFGDSTGNTVSVPGATLAGYVNSTTGAIASGGTLKFQTSIAYYQTDPSDQGLAWLKDPANVMSCPLSSAPAYAYLQTHGLVSGQASVSGDRTQHATYKFNTTNQNVQGGRLVSFGSSPASCIDAGTSEPKAGAVLTMQACLALGTPQQSFSYQTDLTLLYQGDPTLKLCIQAPTSNGSVTLQKCVAPALDSNSKPITYPYVSGQQVQEWSFDDNGHFETAGNNGNVSGTCLQPLNQADPNQASFGTLLVTTGCSGSTSSLNAWNPDPQVGAGKAGGNIVGVPGAPTNQFVNYSEFGRCLDITGQDVTANHLIDYPCKQAPDATKLTFNQVWTYTAQGSTGYGTMSVNKSGTYYCLTAPASASAYYIVVSPTGNGSSTCMASPTSAQLWQPTGNLAGNYPNSYELISQSLGLCMSASTAPNGDLTPNSSNIIVETCNGTLREKWNAPPTNPLVGLSNIAEDSGGANIGGG